jgi:signal transduction histidine kinase
MFGVEGMSEHAVVAASGQLAFLILLLLLGMAAYFGLRLLRPRSSLGDMAALLALALIAPLTALMVQFAQDERQAAISAAKEKLVFSSKYIAENSGRMLQQTRSILNLILLAPETYLPDDDCYKYLSLTAKYFSWLKALAITNENGEVICASKKEFLGLGVGDHAFFSDVQLRRRFTVSEVVSLHSEDYGIIAALPHGPGYPQTGVIFAFLQLDIFATALQPVVTRDATHIAIIDRAGRLLARHPSDPKRVGQVLADRDYVLHALGRSGNVFHAQGPNGEPHIYATQRLADFDGVVIVGRRSDDVLQPIEDKLKQRLMLIAALILSVLLIGYVSGQKLIFEPLQALADFAFKLESGHLDARLTIRPKGEIGQVCKAFDVMAQALAKRDAKLRETSSMLTSIFNSMQESIFVFNVGEANNIVLVDWNAAAAAQTGMMPNGRLHRLDDLLPELDTGRMLKDLETAYDSGRPVPFEYADASGERTWEGIHVPIKTQDDKVWCLFTSIIEVTERKRAERMQRDFISTVSHELRTPLTAISGSLGLILGGTRQGMSETEKHLLRIAHENSLRLVRLVNDILDIEKIEAGRLEVHIHPIVLDATVREALEQVASYAEQYQVKLKFEGNCPDDRVCADKDKLIQIVTNLISNAVKFSPPGETVTVRTSMGPRAGFARISVIDRGPGIPASFRPRLFKKFAQADTSDTRKKGGTGLGLAICKELIERLGGKLSLETEEGRGTTFHADVRLTEPEGICQAQAERRPA